MPNVSHTIIAKSDQLNFDDIRTGEKIIEITKVLVTATDQPVSIFYKDDNNKPYKPCKGMIRLICEAWGEESENWHGKSMKLYGEDAVRWAGQEIGGIRIRALSDIDSRGLSSYVAISRGKRRKVTIEFLKAAPPIQKKHKCPHCEAVEITFIQQTELWTCGACSHEIEPKKETTSKDKK